MTDANLVRVMQAQCRSKVGLVPWDVVRRGGDAIRARIAELQAQGVRFGIVDAITNDDLVALGAAVADAPLVVAGSGVAIALPRNHGIEPSERAAELPPASGYAAIVSGSCSVATNAQVAEFRHGGGSAYAVDPMRIAAGDDVAAEALEWAKPRLGKQPVLVYATAAPDSVKEVQGALGAARAGELVEGTLAAVAKGLVDAGVRRLVIAGGETSGAVVKALDIEQLRIGAQIDPGVPWCYAGGLHVALKSGNFGSPDFFTKAFEVLA
jgi:uncharacterized protein YgbK (DUF1537 family)